MILYTGFVTMTRCLYMNYICFVHDGNTIILVYVYYTLTFLIIETHNKLNDVFCSLSTRNNSPFITTMYHFNVCTSAHCTAVQTRVVNY